MNNKNLFLMVFVVKKSKIKVGSVSNGVLVSLLGSLAVFFLWWIGKGSFWVQWWWLCSSEQTVTPRLLCLNAIFFRDRISTCEVWNWEAKILTTVTIAWILATSSFVEHVSRCLLCFYIEAWGFLANISLSLIYLWLYNQLIHPNHLAHLGGLFHMWFKVIWELWLATAPQLRLCRKVLFIIYFP